MKASLHEIRAEFSLTCTALGIIGKGLFSFNTEKTKDAINMLAGPVGAVKMGEILYSS
ncbi:MAG: hypothetical protein LBI53_04330 [Candidatus Peribacteria bacterium]|jgi:uncharacterized protein YaaW (UPF0174 family)|nr:hypothetical protein [Candidatus Peribacteria bacterium]